MGVAHGSLSASCVLTMNRSPQGRGEIADVREAAMRPSFHSPERLGGQGISPADDTWGAAVTLYYLLTGNLPFPGETSQQIRQRMAGSPPAPLAVFDAGDDELQQLLDRFLARDPGRRSHRLLEFLQGLQQWRQRHGQPDLPALDEASDDSFGDDEEEIATVMRDIGDVREQLRQLQQQQKLGSPTGAPAPRPGGVPRPGGSGPGVPPPRGSGPGVPPPRGSGPGAPPPRGSGPGVPPPAGRHPGYRGAPPPPPPTAAFEIDDDDSEDQSTVLMDTEGSSLGDAIAAAVAAKNAQSPLASPLGEEDDDLGGAATVLMTDDLAGIDFSNVPDPTGGEPPPGRREPDSLPAPPPIDDPITFGDAPGLDAIENSLDAAAAAAPSSPPTAMLPEGYQSEVDRILAGQVGHAPAPTPDPVPMPVEAPPKSGGAVRVALVVSSVLLVLVVVWIGLLLAERAGAVTLPF